MKYLVKNEMRKFFAAFLIALFCFTESICQVQAEEAEKTDYEFTDNLYARSAVLMDADSGRILYGKEENELLPMASTTKILTCILALERGDLQELVTVSAYAASMPKVKLYMKEGEQYRLGDLLYSLMLESHNDTAVAIAEHIGGSMEEFAILMNQKAGEIGCTQSFFITPNGLDATAMVETDAGSQMMTHATTATELARIMAYCIRKSPKCAEFLQITQTQDYSFCNKKMQEDGTVTDAGRSFSCQNHNAFLSMMEGAISGKTGFTGNAGYCYVGALESEGRTYVVALLACGWPNNKTYKWSDTKKLMNYGINNFEQHTLTEKKLPEEAMTPIPVENGQTIRLEDRAYVSLILEQEEDSREWEEEQTILLRKDETIQMTYTVEQKLEAPVQAGRKAGQVRFYIQSADGTQTDLYRQNILTAEGIDKIDFGWCLGQTLQRFLIA